jgi:hypothetical protein
MTDPTKVLCKGLASRLAVRVDAAIFGWLQCITLHTHDLSYCVSIQRLVLVCHGKLALLFAAEAAGVEAACRTPK